MDIQRKHEKILDHLIKLRETDKTLYFVPRKINNQQRLDKGYWFIGNENYLNLSFWNGSDWKEKIHNIGFVVSEDGNTYISLSAQDSIVKARFFEKLVTKISGYKKDVSKNKWVKHYSDSDIIKNLNSFINNEKPIIDKLIKEENPKGISLLNKNFDNIYTAPIIKLRQKQKLIGETIKLSRICWNTENWKFPSGSHGKSVSIDTYEADKGYGHEEWLFDKSKIVEDYHYAFLQPLFLKSDIHYNKIYDISLYSINNLNKKYYVGEIKNVECITPTESERVYDIYKSEGWLKQMKSEVERVGANYIRFSQTAPKEFFNIRFKFTNLTRPDELIEIGENDINITTNHYKLLPRKSEIEFGITNDEEENEGNKKNTNKRRKVFNSECEYDPYHDQMQNAIFELLKNSKKHDYKYVYIEKDRVDIKAKTNQNKWHYFEIKTDNPKLSIRKALGQIMEYSYFPNLVKAEKLIIVSDEEPKPEIITYLNHIRDIFNIPVTYRYFNLETNKLSEDY